MSTNGYTQFSLGKFNNKLNKIILNNYYLYIIGKNENFENSSEIEKNKVSMILKSLNILANSEIDFALTEERRRNLEIQYWSIKEIVNSSFNVYIKFLTKELLQEKLIKTYDYFKDFNEKNLIEFMSYYIKSIKNSLKDLSEKKVLLSGN